MAQPASDLAVDDLKGGYAGTQVLDGLSFRVGAGRSSGFSGATASARPPRLRASWGSPKPRAGAFRSAAPTSRRCRHGAGPAPASVMCRRPATSSNPSAWRKTSSVLRARVRTTSGSSLPSSYFRGCASAATTTARNCQAANSRCSRSRAPSYPAPSLLLMDEPLEGLAPRIREELMDAIRNMIGGDRPQLHPGRAACRCGSEFRRSDLDPGARQAGFSRSAVRAARQILRSSIMRSVSGKWPLSAAQPPSH